MSTITKEQIAASFDFMTPREAAERLSVSRITVYRWIKAGKIPAYRFGPRLYRINGKEISKESLFVRSYARWAVALKGPYA